MKKTKLLMAISLLGLLGGVHPAAAIGTAFTYQGRLVDAGSPASGNYDLRFSVWDSAVAGSQVGASLVLAPVSVSSGLFTVPLDFGGGIFTGPDRWLQIESRVFGGPSYSLITPRQKLSPTPYAIMANSVAATAGAVPDAGLSPNVALLNRTPQTFTGANIFDRGSGGPGRLIVTGSSSPDLTAFTGLGFQYYDSSGEGAIMSSYNDGYGFLSFYTKSAGGQPITKQMIISKYGDVAIDQSGANDGFLNNGTLGGAGLSFGSGSGEGIASKRTATGNQNGLDFYTAFTARMSILNGGYVGIGRQSPITGADIFDVRSPSASGYGGMYMDTAGATALPFYGYALNGSAIAWTYLDGSDGNKWKVWNNGDQLTVTPAGTVGIGTTTPGAKLDVRGDVKMGATGQYFATGGAENLRIVRGIVTPSGGIYNGTGFTITHNGAGDYTISFSPAFADTPSLTITAYTAGSPVTANCTGGTASGFSTIYTWVGAVKADSWWNFTAIGAR